MVNPMSAVSQIRFKLVKRNCQMYSIIITNEKLIGLGLIKLQDIVESSALLIKRFELMYAFECVCKLYVKIVGLEARRQEHYLSTTGSL